MSWPRTGSLDSPVDHVHRLTDGLPEGVLQSKISVDQLEKVVAYNVHPPRKEETGGDPIHDINQTLLWRWLQSGSEDAVRRTDNHDYYFS